MNGKKPTPDENGVFQTPDNKDVDLGIPNMDDFFNSESNGTVMHAPEDWPPPPADVGPEES